MQDPPATRPFKSIKRLQISHGSCADQRSKSELLRHSLESPCGFVPGFGPATSELRWNCRKNARFGE
ncbi:hypothetical protein N7510_006462 [Penicillium lagena]|uniref:uncharacterized protein n=1 Tax=Penicillium lagena TaxID=94218 RepID=UPI00253FAEC5|nr:uncharacterized protein N7510_006462 [Penicillium lagena]KAJ5613268.1 hypothetical protein N7510_006462 [Penicillium lagena]